MWGAGTAIGELPPYFMARTARLSGEKLEDEEEDKESKWYPVKQTIKTLVERVGFLGILACASVRCVAVETSASKAISSLQPIRKEPRLTLSILCTDPESAVRFRRFRMRPLSGSILDLLRRHPDRQGHHQGAHSDAVRDRRFQRAPLRVLRR